MTQTALRSPRAFQPANDEPDAPLPLWTEAAPDAGLAAYLGMSKRRFRSWVGGLLALLLLLLLWNHIFIPIGSGQSGVLWSRLGGGTVTERRYGEGFHAIWPWDHMAIYDLRFQELHGPVEVLTSDGLHVTMDMTVRYRPRAADLIALHQRVGPRYRATVLWPDAVAALRKVVRRFKPEELTMLGESDLAQRVEADARRSIDRHWVELDRVLITRIALPQRVQAQIQEKLADEQKALAAPFILKQAELKRQGWMIEAEGARAFQARTGTSLVQWRSIDALEKLAQSPNAKVVVVGGGKEMPFVLDPGSGESKSVQK